MEEGERSIVESTMRCVRAYGSIQFDHRLGDTPPSRLESHPEEQRDKHDVTQRKDKIFSIKNRKEGRGEFPVDSVRICTLHCVSYHLVEERSIDLQLKSVCKKKKSGSMRFLLCAMSNC